MDERYGPRGRKNKRMTLAVVAALLLTVTCLVGIFVDETSVVEPQGAVVSYVNAAGSEGKDEPRVVGGFVPNRRLGPPPQKPDEEILSWDLINGLFAVIIFLELVVFPLLFWLWFGKEQHTNPK